MIQQKFGHSQKLQSVFTPRLRLDCAPAFEREKAVMSLDKYSAYLTYLVGTCMKPDSRSVELKHQLNSAERFGG